MLKLVDLALGQRLITIVAALGLAAWGLYSYSKLPIDAFPDVAPVQVLVSMRAPGLTPEELESRVTAPIEIGVRGIPNLVSMRSTTRYSVALMTFEFSEGTDIYWARAQVNERLAAIADQLPDRRLGRPRADRDAARRNAHVHDRRRRSHAHRTARPDRLDHSPAPCEACRASPTSMCSAGFVRTFEVVPSPPAMAARGITVACSTARSPEIIATTAPAASATARRRCWCARRAGCDTLDDIKSVVIAARRRASCGSAMSPRCAMGPCRATASLRAMAKARRFGGWCSVCAAPTRGLSWRA